MPTRRDIARTASPAPAPPQSLGRPDVKNFVLDLVELRVHVQAPNDPDRPLELSAELRVGIGDVADGDRLIPVSIAGLEVAVDISGLEPAAGLRLGESEKPNNAVRTVATTVSTQTTGAIKGKAGVTAGVAGVIPSVSASVEGTKQQKVDVKTTYKEKVETSRVTARPNLRWEVRETDGAPLNDIYLHGQTLCSLQPLAGANRTEVTVVAAVKQRDLRFDTPERHSFFKDKLREKLTRIFIAKCLHGGGANYEGRIIVSRITIESE